MAVLGYSPDTGLEMIQQRRSLSKETLSPFLLSAKVCVLPILQPLYTPLSRNSQTLHVLQPLLPGIGGHVTPSYLLRRVVSQMVESLRSDTRQRCNWNLQGPGVRNHEGPH